VSSKLKFNSFKIGLGNDTSRTLDATQLSGLCALKWSALRRGEVYIKVGWTSFHASYTNNLVGIT